MVAWHFNNETVYHQMPWAGNLAKTVRSNRQQLTAVALDQSTLLKVAWCCFWSLDTSSHRFDPLVLLYITNHLMTIPLGKLVFCFRPWISMFPETFLRDVIHCCSQSFSVHCYWPHFKKVLEIHKSELKWSDLEKRNYQWQSPFICN